MSATPEPGSLTDFLIHATWLVPAMWAAAMVLVGIPMALLAGHCAADWVRGGRKF